MLYWHLNWRKVRSSSFLQCKSIICFHNKQSAYGVTIYFSKKEIPQDCEAIFQSAGNRLKHPIVQKKTGMDP